MKVIVIILNFKVKALTIKCVESVKKSTYPVKIIVVDNKSEDGLDLEINKFKDVEFIQTGKNLGFTGGNNFGIKKALANGADLVLILNPDTTTNKDCIKNLVEGMEEIGAGVVGPKIYFKDEKTIWYAGGVMDKLNVLGKHRGVDQKDQGQYEKVIETDYVSGAAMMVKREVFENVGLFDERYFLYYEDSDFCERAKKTGYKIMYLPKAMVYHANAQSAGLGSPLQDYYITRNRMLYAKKFLPLRTQLALLREALKNLGNPNRRLALWDFLTGNLGKGSFS